MYNFAFTLKVTLYFINGTFYSITLFQKFFIVNFLNDLLDCIFATLRIRSLFLCLSFHRLTLRKTWTSPVDQVGNRLRLFSYCVEIVLIIWSRILYSLLSGVAVWNKSEFTGDFVDVLLNCLPQVNGLWSLLKLVQNTIFVSRSELSRCFAWNLFGFKNCDYHHIQTKIKASLLEL